MATANTHIPVPPTETSAPPRPLRVWPGLTVVVLQWFAWLVLPKLVPEAAMPALLGGIFGGGLAVLVWWLFFSRAPWSERLGAIVLIAAAMFATSRIVHPSIAGGAMGMLLPLYAIPVLSLVLVCWAAACRRLPTGPRRASMVATILVACAGFTLIRTGGMSGDGDEDLHWRWTPTAEQRLVARGDTEPMAGSAIVTASESVAIWPGFRGPARDGVVRGARISTDWLKSPPVELWRRPIGPGWSSFAVSGDFLYTQEQRDKEEDVSCYTLSTGKPVWRHRDAVRFWESNGGPGPRATPTLGDGRVYTLGATGIANALDAASGAVVWSHNAAADTEAELPGWGFAGSPLLVDDMVVVATAARLVAYDHVTGKCRWVGPKKGRDGYSSPHLATIDGVKQILLLKAAGVISVAPDTGKELWTHDWLSDGIVQPSLTPDGDVLIGGGGMNPGVGVRRLVVAHGAGGWTVKECWTSPGLKPYFNDFVVHKGHAFGFDGNMLACIDLENGKRAWKGGRYGHGQMILLPDQDLLVVLSEKGEFALVGATPDQFKEIARIPAITGKTWNHPVLAGDVLLARNGEEMVAFRLSPTKR